ncbi:MAG: dimethyl sulfoxide reductase anchor subunit [Planctomycetales bacterium]|nr:dimethyl sulfoxide reductase anchor subunit [Planctomycetales bacterium]
MATTALDLDRLGSRSIVELLLDEQAQFSAVELFSDYHDQLTDGTEPAQAKYYRALLPARSPSEGEQYAFDVDLDACSGCKSCVVACHTLNGLEEEEAWRRVGTVSNADESSGSALRYITTACHHCSEPGCLNGCPVKAYEKSPETGIVKHLDDQCIGCKYCMMMCPYEVPRYSQRLGIVRKCDMCSQRLMHGEAPACVQSCPNTAISIRLISKKEVAPPGDQRLAPGAPLSSITRPTTIYRTANADAFHDASPLDQDIDHPHESHWPLAVMLCATQASVGLLLFERLWTFFDSSPEVTRAALLASLVLAIAGLAVAPLHLGQPMRAWRVFLGLRTSWLSREAVLLGNYVGGLVLAIGLAWSKPLNVPLVSSLSNSYSIQTAVWVALASGMTGIISSGMIYVATRRELWSFSKTMLQFGGTALVTGAVWLAATVLAVKAFDSANLSVFSARFLAIAATVCLIAKVGWEWRFRLGPDRSSDSSLQRRSRLVVRRHLALLKRLRLSLAALAALSMLACTALLSMSAIGLSIAVLAAVVCSAGEICARLLYFSSIVFERMPGALR